MITRDGVCYDLAISPYKTTINGLTFVFSSKLHLDKFKQKIKENRDIINYSLSKRFKVNVDVSKLADVVLYRKVETRGFLIITGEGKEICQRNITYVGGEVIIQD